MEGFNVYKDIQDRTHGEIYIGVVGPVRTGKSTFIKKFMDTVVIPHIPDGIQRERAIDELPQSSAGRTIMTTEPKFIPESAVPLALEGGGECSIRLIDCVGYMVEGAMGHEENDKPRMVKSPWFDEEIPFDLAAEVGGNHACGKFHIVLKVIFDVYVVRHQSRRVAAEGDELPDDAR